ncbi:MAG TPA: TIGR02452 family protein [Gemmataceae bacterium]|nr:TIGR02452 family protein [Gemmataceae bacterium]
MTSRSHLAQIGRETLAILDRGEYVSPGGVPVNLAEGMGYAKAHSVHYTPEMFAEVFRLRNELLNTAPKFSTTFEVVNRTTLAAARQLCDLEPGVDVLCLNFASARHPGGGFLGGARAQEESLARSSGLYPCIAQMQGMYEANKRFGSCLYTDHMIYSPKVPVFRDDDTNLLDQPYTVAFLTAPAVNAGAVKEHELSLIEPTMYARIEKLLSIAVVQRHHTLVLGAWGCGVFKNDTTRVAQAFRRHLIETQTFHGAFEKVVFAVTDWSPERRFIGPFEAVFPVDTAS